jgi:Domain of unknown function (DUF6457)
MVDLSPASDRVNDQDAILAAWCAELVSRLGLEGVEVDVDAVLSLAGQVAHAVVRPAAPLTAFVVGYAAGLAVGRTTSADAPTFEDAFEGAAATARDAAAGFDAAS